MHPFRFSEIQIFGENLQEQERSPATVKKYLRHLEQFYLWLPEAKLADVLGHSSIETTRIYLLSSGQEHRKNPGRSATDLLSINREQNISSVLFFFAVFSPVSGVHSEKEQRLCRFYLTGQRCCTLIRIIVSISILKLT